MTMLVKQNWNEDEEWYEVPLADVMKPYEIDEHVLAELKPDQSYRYVAWYDKRSKNWIAYIVDAENHQIGDAYFAHSKRTFMY